MWSFIPEYASFLFNLLLNAAFPLLTVAFQSAEDKLCLFENVFALLPKGYFRCKQNLE